MANLKTKLYIDLSYLMSTNFTTGIQRVVKEVVIRLFNKPDIELILLNYDQRNNNFTIIDNEAFFNFFQYGEGLKALCLTQKKLEYNALVAGSTFFDIDGVWNSRLTRSHLYPILKDTGVQIVTMVYDIIPVTHPQYCHQSTIMRFLTYLGAVLRYADHIIVNTKATEEQIRQLCTQIGETCPPCMVAPLGADFQQPLPKKEETEEAQPEDAEADAEKQPTAFDRATEIAAAGKYILMVGTIEPRKNHKLLVDALDKGLDINVVFAGKIGWNVDDLISRIKSHALYEKRLFLMNDADDQTIHYLYQHAYYLAFPTFNEGFGLPMIESFQKGTPVIASDIPVLREVGGDFADYFDNTSPKALLEFIRSSLQDSAAYAAKKEKLKDFVPYTWDEAADNIYGFLLENSRQMGSVEDLNLKQMVVLTARHEDIMKSLPHIEAYMPFIQELVVCCPEKNVQPFKDNYHGRLRLIFKTDDELLQGKPLPEDHVARNFFLRCQAMRLDCLDDVFIMTDDDYRPLVPISKDVYIKNGRYVGYYFYDLKEWQGSYSHYKSFDLGAFYTRDFLMENGYPTMQYASHMPQIIDKRIFREILETHPGIENNAYEEWDIYFNYGMRRHPDKFMSKPYVSICWPGRLTSWNLYTFPNPMLFENYYEELYDDNNLFAGLSKEYDPETTDAENREKIRIFSEAVRKQFEERKVFDSYCRLYNNSCGSYPSYIIYIDKKTGRLALHLPGYLKLQSDCWTRIPLTITEEVYQAYPGKILKVGYHFFNAREISVLNSPMTPIETGDKHVMLPVRSPKARVRGGAMIFYARMEEPLTEEEQALADAGEKLKERKPIDEIIRRIPATFS